MPTSLTSTIRASISAVNRKTRAGHDTVETIPNSPDVALAYGNGYARADIAFSDIRALGPSTNESLDLAGVLTDAFGQTITAAKVKAIEIENPEASLSTITVGGAASNTFNGPFSGPTFTIDLKPGDKAVFVSRTGWIVTATTGDLLKVANGAGGGVSYIIKIIASSL